MAITLYFKCKKCGKVYNKNVPNEFADAFLPCPACKKSNGIMKMFIATNKGENKNASLSIRM